MDVETAAQTIAALIDKGKLDKHISELSAAVRDRQLYLRTLTAQKVRREIRIGSTVKLFGLRPKHINGRVVEVVGVNRTRLVVMLDGRRNTVPMTCVELVEDVA